MSEGDHYDKISIGDPITGNRREILWVGLLVELGDGRQGQWLVVSMEVLIDGLSISQDGWGFFLV